MLKFNGFDVPNNKKARQLTIFLFDAIKICQVLIRVVVQYDIISNQVSVTVLMFMCSSIDSVTSHVIMPGRRPMC